MPTDTTIRHPVQRNMQITLPHETCARVWVGPARSYRLAEVVVDAMEQDAIDPARAHRMGFAKRRNGNGAL